MIGFFEESEDKKSIGRLTSFIIVCVTLSIVIYQTISGQHINETLIIGMLATGVGMKVAQKFAEKK